LYRYDSKSQRNNLKGHVERTEVIIITSTI
jgi:hypothetical protein